MVVFGDRHYDLTTFSRHLVWYFSSFEPHYLLADENRFFFIFSDGDFLSDLLVFYGFRLCASAQLAHQLLKNVVWSSGFPLLWGVPRDFCCPVADRNRSSPFCLADEVWMSSFLLGRRSLSPGSVVVGNWIGPCSGVDSFWISPLLSTLSAFLLLGWISAGTHLSSDYLRNWLTDFVVNSSWWLDITLRVPTPRPRYLSFSSPTSSMVVNLNGHRRCCSCSSCSLTEVPSFWRTWCRLCVSFCSRWLKPCGFGWMTDPDRSCSTHHNYSDFVNILVVDGGVCCFPPFVGFANRKSS